MEPLVAGSPTARALYRIMVGQKVVTLHTGSGHQAEMDAIAAIFGRLSATVTSPWTMAVIPIATGAASIRLAADEYERNFRHRGLLVNDQMLMRVPGVLRIRTDKSVPGFPVRLMDVEESRFKAQTCELLVIRSDRHGRLREADRVFRASQVLVLKDRARPGDPRRAARLPVTPGVWGEIPAEVALAGGPS